MSTLQRTLKSRYEYFEAWLTPKEWATWKKHSVKGFQDLFSCTESEARARRNEYLNEPFPFEAFPTDTIRYMFETTIDRYLSWRNTPQGLGYWQSVALRTRPIRTLKTI
jgi:hypothetical protein